jgi:hypothetical protein
VSFGQALRFWFKLGFVSFGGPAGQIALMREFTLLYAPNINSYKRYAYGSFAPTTLLWGRDNRTAAFRSVGHGKGLRLETRIADITKKVQAWESKTEALREKLKQHNHELTLREASAPESAAA